MRFCPWASEPMEELSPRTITCKHSHNVCTEKGAAVLAPSTPAYMGDVFQTHIDKANLGIRISVVAFYVSK